eukprot:5281026-Prymnesium_polylepis.1
MSHPGRVRSDGALVRLPHGCSRRGRGRAERCRRGRARLTIALGVRRRRLPPIAEESVRAPPRLDLHAPPGPEGILRRGKGERAPELRVR